MEIQLALRWQPSLRIDGPVHITLDTPIPQPKSAGPDTEVQLDLYKLEYGKCLERYENIYKSIWTQFNYFLLAGGAILTFGKDTLGVELSGLLACLVLIFWFWATFHPLNKYGDEVASRAGEIEDALNGLAFSVRCTECAPDAKKNGQSTPARIGKFICHWFKLLVWVTPQSKAPHTSGLNHFIKHNARMDERVLNPVVRLLYIGLGIILALAYYSYARVAIQWRSGLKFADALGAGNPIWNRLLVDHSEQNSALTLEFCLVVTSSLLICCIVAVLWKERLTLSVRTLVRLFSMALHIICLSLLCTYGYFRFANVSPLAQEITLQYTRPQKGNPSATEVYTIKLTGQDANKAVNQLNNVRQTIDPASKK